MKNWKTASGSFLADIIVAMVILTMSITTSLTLINQSITTNSVNKNKITAVNLAREGLEAMRIIRDTNWMRYGTKKRICWNFWDNTNENHEWNHSSDENCQEDEGIEGVSRHPIGIINPFDKSDTGDTNIQIDPEGIKSFILSLDEINYTWTLVENFYVIPKNGDISQKIPTCKKTELVHNEECTTGDISTTAWASRKDSVNSGVLGSIDISSRLYVTSSGLYTHFPNGNTETDFYREVFIEYPFGEDAFHPAVTEQNSDLVKQNDNQILIKVKVWYKGHGGIMRNVTLETELTDYLQRTDWSE